MSDEHISVELKFTDHSWKPANIGYSFYWAQTSWTRMASTHEVDIYAAFDRLSWSTKSDIHVSAEHEKYQSQINQNLQSQFRMVRGWVDMPHLSYILVWIWYKKPSCSVSMWLAPNHLNKNNMMHCHVSDWLSEKLTKNSRKAMQSQSNLNQVYQT